MSDKFEAMGMPDWLEIHKEIAWRLPGNSERGEDDITAVLLMMVYQMQETTSRLETINDTLKRLADVSADFNETLGRRLGKKAPATTGALNYQNSY